MVDITRDKPQRVSPTVWDMAKKAVYGADGQFNPDAFSRTIIVNTVAEAGISTSAITKVATDAINKEQAGFFQFLGRYIDTKDNFGPLGVEWQLLSENYRKRRLKRGKGFFHNKGYVGRNLASKSGAQLGEPVVRVTEGKIDDRNPLPNFNIEIDLFQALGKTYNLSTIETTFASKRLITPLSKRKLIGKATYHRPLLAPALEYYRNRIGAAVLEAVKKAGYDVTGKPDEPEKPKRTPGKKTKAKQTKPKILRGKALDRRVEFTVETESRDEQRKRLRDLRLKQSLANKSK